MFIKPIAAPIRVIKAKEYLAEFYKQLMPEVWRKTGKNYSILVWQSTEPMNVLLTKASLSVYEFEKWRTFISEKRKRESGARVVIAF